MYFFKKQKEPQGILFFFFLKMHWEDNGFFLQSELLRGNHTQQIHVLVKKLAEFHTRAARSQIFINGFP